MPHVIEPAASGRAKCRGCGKAIAKGALRLGERLPNPFADEGEMTLWFHLDCAAYKRPEALAEALAEHGADIENRAWLAEVARVGIEHRRLPRIDGVERASTGRAACRSCHEKIAKGAWRLRLVFFDEGRFAPSGFIHVACATQYVGVPVALERLKHFSGDIEDAEWSALEASLA